MNKNDKSPRFYFRFYFCQLIKIKAKNCEKKLLIFCLFSVLLTTVVAAQSGGPFNITQSVAASGGAEASSGSSFEVVSTIGQLLAGERPSGGNFIVRNGFWTASFLPIAGVVSAGGRVTTASGYGIRNAIITIIRMGGETRLARTGTFGYFRFDGVMVGETYVFTVTSKQFSFSQPTQVYSIFEEVEDINFVANE